jgi:hypothetical protein
MVTPTDFNLQNLRTRAFQGFVQFQNPGNSLEFLRLKERQTVNVTFNFGREPHYNDSGIKALDPNGHNHSYTMVLKVTSDLIDDQYNKVDPDTGAERETLSYWILKNELYEPIEIIFVTTLEARSGPSSDPTEKFLQFKFRLDPQVFGPITIGATGGTSNITVSGEVIAIEEIIRTSTEDAP